MWRLLYNNLLESKLLNVIEKNSNNISLTLTKWLKADKNIKKMLVKL